MDAATSYNASSPSVSLHSGGSESDINKSSISVKTSRDSESTVEIITRFEWDIVCICEKLTNLNLLSMHVETKEIDFETSIFDMDSDLVIKTVEYDLLSGFLCSEMRILETHISDLQKEKDNVKELLSSRKHSGELVSGMEEMLHDSEKSLEQSMEQVTEIKIRSANFEKNVQRFSEDKDYIEVVNSNDLQEREKMKMKTMEHQRHVLRMLEKSLGREMDLEKRASDLTQVEETLMMRLRMLELELVDAEKEAETTLEKFYEKDHTSELLMQTSKELVSKIKMLQFNLKGSIQREAELKNDLLKLKERFTEEKETSKGIVEMENRISDLRQQIIKAENGALNYEDKCQELHDTREKIVLLEKELCKVRVKLQDAEACCEAIEDEKDMFFSTIKDMEDVMDVLTEKVAEAEIQTHNVEEKCIPLSETNADLKKELEFVKGKVKERFTEEKETSNGIVEMENTIRDLRQQIIEAENRALNYEDKCQELHDTCEKMVLLDKELCEVRVKLQHAEACCEASEEDKNMFFSTIQDMENVMDDLKKKVTQAEIQTDNVEERCVLLSETNADLKKELKFVKGKVKNLETSLRRMEETKKASAKDINLCSKFITDLVVQMKLERERLQKQISSLKQENKILVNCLKKDDKDPAVKESHDDTATSNDFTTENSEALSSSLEVEKAYKETVTGSTEAVRDIDARQLKTRDILLVLFVLIVPLIGVLVYQTQVC